MIKASDANARVLRIDPRDDVLVALTDLDAGMAVEDSGASVTLREAVPAKHKISIHDLPRGSRIQMYGTTAAEAVCDIVAGDRITTGNVIHATADVTTDAVRTTWQPPDVSRWRDATFLGYAREDGRVGTANYWIVVPLVFCQNRNLLMLQDALLEGLGYAPDRSYQSHTRMLIDLYRNGTGAGEILDVDFKHEVKSQPESKRIFDNVDGVKFLKHELGCGGTFDDAYTLCGLLAGYINHPNVAGATVLSLGCQKAQIENLEQEIYRRNSKFNKPLYILEQQQLGTESAFMSAALKHTFAGLMQANECRREPAALSHLSIGLECGGSDGFSGISANPAIGHAADLTVALGGTVVLSEFPELAGAEQDLVNRAVDQPTAERFMQIMQTYSARAEAVGSGFDQNPSPGNVADGLTTDAIKSLGAAKKGGSSPVVDALDYPEMVTKPGLNLLCTPGGDIESVTAMVGSGANVVLFSTGLGTPTGNPIAPVLKVSSNNEVAQKMPDIIDIDAGGIINGKTTIDHVGEQILDRIVRTASGQSQTCAQVLAQDDFIPWKRGISI